MRPHVTTPSPGLSRRRILQVAAGAAATTALAPLAATPALAQPQEYQTMDAPAAHDAALAGEIILVDIRTPPEWAETGIGEGAVAINLRDPDFVQALVRLRQSYPDKPIALICRTGNRSGYAVSTLAQQGFPGLVDIPEGMAGSAAGPGWIARGLPVYPGTEAEIAPRLAAVLGE